MTLPSATRVSRRRDASDLRVDVCAHLLVRTRTSSHTHTSPQYRAQKTHTHTNNPGAHHACQDKPLAHASEFQLSPYHTSPRAGEGWGAAGFLGFTSPVHERALGVDTRASTSLRLSTPSVHGSDERELGLTLCHIDLHIVPALAGGLTNHTRERCDVQDQAAEEGERERERVRG